MQRKTWKMINIGTCTNRIRWNNYLSVSKWIERESDEWEVKQSKATVRVCMCVCARAFLYVQVYDFGLIRICQMAKTLLSSCCKSPSFFEYIGRFRYNQSSDMQSNKQMPHEKWQFFFWMARKNNSTCTICSLRGANWCGTTTTMKI